jgi:hypothetical protein
MNFKNSQQRIAESLNITFASKWARSSPGCDTGCKKMLFFPEEEEGGPASK